MKKAHSLQQQRMGKVKSITPHNRNVSIPQNKIMFKILNKKRGKTNEVFTKKTE